MKPPEILLNTMAQNKSFHGTPIANGIKPANARHLSTPTVEEYLLQPDAEKIERIAQKFGEIMDILGLDRTDDSLKDTPKRVAKMFVLEQFAGLNPLNKPEVTLFENRYHYEEMILERNITVHSTCEHHFVPILGFCHVAYFASGQVVGLSKLNRIVRYFAKRPQVQERLTEQIAAELKKVLRTEDVAVYLDAEHLCVKMRGVEDAHSSTVTSHFSGKFQEPAVRAEFLQAIRG
ncbi:MAG: GTP cyclohydrolase I FolE [Cryomorphaceae bacterium]|jgi:GTP cyclohydrolase I|nr:GTP cyclohydrolase I FolE [Cryomorphaceae bacterium]